MGVDAQQHRVVTGLNASRLSRSFRIRTLCPPTKTDSATSTQEGKRTLFKILECGSLSGLCWAVLICLLLFFLPNISTPHIQIQRLDKVTWSHCADFEFGQDNTCDLCLDVLIPRPCYSSGFCKRPVSSIYRIGEWT